MEDKSAHERYHRQVILKGFGTVAQNALLNARVLVIGAGGLGCPVLQYLTAAGLGNIGIVDNDVVSVSNLHRQVLYDTTDIGKLKVTAAAEKLRLMNPDTEITEYQIHFDKNNCLDIISKYDIIVDCTDNFSSRYLINDACVLKEKPLVFAAVNRYEGQLAVFNVYIKGKGRTGNYRDLFPEQPEQGEVLNCAEAGVLGVLPGVIGSLQSCEVIKLITGIGEPIVNQLMTYNALNNQFTVFNYTNNTNASGFMPGNVDDFLKMNYENECVINGNHFEINVEIFDKLLHQNNTRLIDVRESYELPSVNEFACTRIPLRELKEKLNELVEDNVVFFCQSGIRSLQAAAMAAEHFKNNNRFYSLRGGIVSWKKIHEKQLS